MGRQFLCVFTRFTTLLSLRKKWTTHSLLYQHVTVLICLLHVLLMHEIFSSKKENSIHLADCQSFKLESVEWESQCFSKAMHSSSNCIQTRVNGFYCQQTFSHCSHNYVLNVEECSKLSSPLHPPPPQTKKERNRRYQTERKIGVVCV